MADETWFSAQEALEFGLVDEVAQPLRVAASFDLSGFGYRRPPVQAIDALPPAEIDDAGGVPDRVTKDACTAEPAAEAGARRDGRRGQAQPEARARRRPVRHVLRRKEAMKTRYDYRALEDKAKGLQGQAEAIHALRDEDGNVPEHKRDELMRLMGEIHALEDTAGEMKDAELAELREIVERGSTLTGAGQAAGEAEMANFRHYIKTGEIRDASLSATDANGGYIVPEPAHAELIEKVRKVDPIFGNATLFRLTGDVVIQLPYKSAHGVVANATETGARSEQNAPTFTGPTLTCYDYYSDQRATQQ